MKARRLFVLAIALAAVSALLVGDSIAGGGQPRKFRWDIPSIDFTATPPKVNPGGEAFAQANDDSRIRLTGRGTFVPRYPDRVTGGGTWETFDSGGTSTGSGSYVVTGLVRWVRAPGDPPPFTINIPGSPSAGLAVFKIRYSDGSKGVLVVSCHLVGTSDAVFEGITATKGYVDYWEREAPVDGVDGNRTLFTRIR